MQHNAVVVDGRSQNECGGELLGFVVADGFRAAAARTIDAWPGVEHARCLLLTDDYLLVLDRLSGQDEHDFDWLYHDRAPFVLLRRHGTSASFAAVLAAAATDQPGAVTGIRSAPSAAGVSVTVECGARTETFAWDGRDGICRR